MNNEPSVSRRKFLGGALAAGASVALAADAAEKQTEPPKQYDRKIKLGLIGGGGRGTWIAKLFQKHGGYTIHALADYFESVAEKTGELLGVDKTRRFCGLSGYKKLLESGVEAVAIEDVPYFYPEQAKAAVDAGLHVYMAKPVAVDVPGTLLVGESGKRAMQKKLCFLVDYQLPSDPAMVEIAKRVREGALGPIAHIASFGFGWHAWPDPPLEKNIESRLRGQIWLSDTALSGDTIVSYDIHIIDGVIAVTGKRPVAASGRARTCRPNPHGDRTDALGVVYEQDDGVLWTHVTQALDNNFDVTTLSASIFGMKATARIQYSGKVFIRGGDKHYVGQIGSVFTEGVQRNIANFYSNITESRFENPTVQRAVDGTLTAILGREAGARRRDLTMEELVKENKELKVSLDGMKL
ncbi:MAG: Gfo/Idh/MocA family oxidoreductase [Verrucomicrobia bacterium]|nr:Gfo/Idh/MocA family oxidoreductase [Verrucomicrobiota bacterium]